jgi:hypothetical protein
VTTGIFAFESPGCLAHKKVLLIYLLTASFELTFQPAPALTRLCKEAAHRLKILTTLTR